jgi:hypothetical protein
VATFKLVYFVRATFFEFFGFFGFFGFFINIPVYGCVIVCTTFYVAIITVRTLCEN